ncbi:MULTISPECIES: 5'/3'-nucleotidase SurE [unclassified Pseudomonas]|uniref:5'/3'-nucleotidase SurE n=1 Tax=unclassified Pseudomonas TaxID=196821 RepID=UPI0025DB918A|nr:MULTISPECIES: 5'/3'-nucleotidase SurE [unclassified Pseudomonas]
MPYPRIESILITNDDGIDAPGLEVLEAVARELANEVWVVAPEQDQSGISHALSIHHPLRVKTRGERRFSVSGTPADCVAIGLRQLLDRPPQLLLSGINKGANLGVETLFSGTVGAAMTGLLLGVPSIALSQFFSRRDAVKWDTARALAPEVIRRLLGMQWAADVCLNVNFPDVAPHQAGPLQITRQGVGRMDGLNITQRTDMREQGYYWLNIDRHERPDFEDSETFVVTHGGVSATPLRFERTDVQVMNQLRSQMSQ